MCLRPQVCLCTEIICLYAFSGLNVFMFVSLSSHSLKYLLLLFYFFLFGGFFVSLFAELLCISMGFAGYIYTGVSNGLVVEVTPKGVVNTLFPRNSYVCGKTIYSKSFSFLEFPHYLLSNRFVASICRSNHVHKFIIYI